MLTNLFDALGTSIQHAIHDMGNNIKGKAAVIAVEKLEKKINGQEHGKAIQEIMHRSFPNGHYDKMKDDVIHYLLELGEGLYGDADQEYAGQLIIYANNIRKKSL